ncbi:antirestriction protein [Aeromonas jandaei]|uniref:antirestriction protein n=1 Tax=Aeromonas jandaei TaxID=650 RepID=UPI001C5A9D40|nr:antirestriction protein [Aeromonas jandaei]MBW3808230.1 antirestriction protein [Aeromonas jandaei]
MDVLIAGLVIESKRMDMMPKYFGRWMMKTEGNIYGWLKEICESYSGGYWEMWEVSNGAFFMVPPAEKEGYTLAVDGNGFEGVLTAHATGVVACLFAYYYMWEMTGDDRFVKLYHALREYALTLEERSLIFSAID